MKIELHKIKIRDLAEGYKDSNEEGVVGWNGKLNIRPKYQRVCLQRQTERCGYRYGKQELSFERHVLGKVRRR